MLKSVLTLTATAALLAACGDGGQAEPDQGPVVSASEAPRNEAIDMDPNTGDGGQTPGASSFTEEQARGAIEQAGYTEVGTLTQNAEGLWQGSAMQAGAQVQVSVDYRGEVTTR